MKPKTRECLWFCWDHHNFCKEQPQNVLRSLSKASFDQTNDVQIWTKGGFHIWQETEMDLKTWKSKSASSILVPSFNFFTLKHSVSASIQKSFKKMSNFELQKETSFSSKPKCTATLFFFSFDLCWNFYPLIFFRENVLVWSKTSQSSYKNTFELKTHECQVTPKNSLL